MDSKIINPDNLLVNAEECQRLSYDMLFDDGSYGSAHGFTHDGRKEEASDLEPEEQEERRKAIRELEEKWQTKLDKAKDEAFERGLQEGKARGRQEAVEEMNRQVDTIKGMLSSAEEHIDGVMDDLKPHVVTMVFNITEKILGLPIKSESLKKKVVSEVKDLLSAVEQDTNITIAVAASDKGFLVSELKEVSEFSHIKITASESLNTGEFALDTPNEHIVKSFKKMLHDFREKVALEEDIELEVAS